MQYYCMVYAANFVYGKNNGGKQKFRTAGTYQIG